MSHIDIRDEKNEITLDASELIKLIRSAHLYVLKKESPLKVLLNFTFSNSMINEVGPEGYAVEIKESLEAAN